MKIALGVVAVLLLAGCSSTSDGGTTLRVESDGSTVDVTWTAADGGQQQATNAAVPWYESFSGSSDSTGVVAQADAAASYVTCTIIVDGKTTTTNTSTGAYAVVTC